MADEQRQHVITSPLNAWPGEIHLPHPDDFNRECWDVYKNGMNMAKRKSYALIHKYGYTGLEMVEAHGEWQMEIPLAEVRAWENAPREERTKLLAWISREIIRYMDEITDPKG